MRRSFVHVSMTFRRMAILAVVYGLPVIGRTTVCAFAQELPNAPAPAALAPAPQKPVPAQLPTAQEPTPQSDPQLTMFRHSQTAPYWISGQANVIFQGKPGFHSPYQGPNSFDSAEEYKTSMVETLFLGYQP
ncbi:MAG TPA: hypothetical protein VJS11_08695, partial [Acidobacteriaceae bacterium]|nr:hypothetical protein [Acidobacteriaceae bacterium]